MRPSKETCPLEAESAANKTDKKDKRDKREEKNSHSERVVHGTMDTQPPHAIMGRKERQNEDETSQKKKVDC